MQTLRIGLVVLVVLLAACDAGSGRSASEPSRSVTLAGSTWRLVAIGGRQAPAGSEVTVAFDPTRVSGNGGCNSYGGGYTFDPASGVLRIGDLVSTKRACVEQALNDLETTFLAALGGATAAALDPAGRLVLSSGSGEIVLGLAS